MRFGCSVARRAPRLIELRVEAVEVGGRGGLQLLRGLAGLGSRLLALGALIPRHPSEPVSCAALQLGLLRVPAHTAEPFGHCGLPVLGLKV
eukprot:5199007-Alexandrium_andersonii.AAC.1